jgi:hypothetical protein
MSYTVAFYAMDGHAFARQMREEPYALVNKVRERSGINDQACTQILEDICRGNLTDDCDPNYYIGLCWLADVASERVTICNFQDFNHLEYLDEIGIWPLLCRYPPPFPIPRCEEPAPGVGYLPVGQMETVAFPALASLVDSGERDVANAREEFRHVLGTLVCDRLDLLAILLDSDA